MLIALEEARMAANEGEVPVGAVLEHSGRVIARDHNRIVQTKNPLAHAELLTLQAATKIHPEKWLLDCTLYVTLEPCAMCAGALVLARVNRLVCAAKDPKAGAAGSVMNIVEAAQLNHRLEVEFGLMGEESSKLLTTFFQNLRNRKL